MTPKGTHRPGDALPRESTPLDSDDPGLVVDGLDDGPDLMDEMAARLASDEPLDLLAEVSALLSALDPRSRPPFERHQPDPDTPTLEELVQLFADVDRVETTALLTVVAEMTTDELLAARLRRAVASRPHPLPGWLERLRHARAGQAMEMVHVLGDGDNLMIEVWWPVADGPDHALTAVVYIDHNLGSVVKDAFVVPGPLKELVTLMREHDEAPGDTDWRVVDPADARARITEAIDHGALVFPPLESESWPAARPLVEWVARLYPEGGTGFERPVWDEKAQAALTEAFFAWPDGRSLGRDADHRQLFESILWFATDYGPGDPLRWSPTAVEILLMDWIPRKLVAPSKFLAKAPLVLRAFIAYAGAERGIRAGLTAETLEAVDHWEPDYQRLIRTPRPQGPAALLATMGVADPDISWDALGEVGELWDPQAAMRSSLLRAVGSEEALEALDDEPLPDEEFSWEGIEGDIRAKVAEILERCDRCCDALLDSEHRTACRRFLAMAARSGPAAFRRPGRSDTAAAAICWTIGKANEAFATGGTGLHVKDLADHFGMAPGSVSQRAVTLLKAAGLVDGSDYLGAWNLALGTPDLLVSARRRRIIQRRDRTAG